MWRLTYLVFIPLLLGCSIYLLFRDTQGLIFEAYVTSPIHIQSITLPDWFLYNLPDGLWLFSGINFFSWVWKNDAGLRQYGYSTTLILLAMISEVLQYLSIIPGTFDWTDLIAYLMVTVLAFSLNHPLNHKHQLSNHDQEQYL